MFARRRNPPAKPDKKAAANGLYVHSNPPKVLQNVNSAQIRLLIRSGDVDKLEQLVLDGQGKKLVGEYSADYKIRTFLKTVPTLMSKINLLHDAVSGGSLNELQNILQEDCARRKKLVLCKDQSGVGLLHKAIYYDLNDIAKWLIENYPQTANVKDAEGRTPAHYISMVKDIREMQRLLTTAGADLYALDNHGHTYKYYVDNPGELELPSSLKPSKTSAAQKNSSAKDGLVIKPSNIRIWIHQRDLGKLQRVLWEGHGAKLRTETCNHPKVKRFLEAVPHLMGLIKDIHSAAINNDLEVIKDRTQDPVPSVILSSKDKNGLNPLHKAAGLGHMDMVNFIMEKWPKCTTAQDLEGRTPLHYTALLKNNEEMYNTLLRGGAEESILDNRQKTAAYYRTRPNEIDAKLVNVIPEAPRTASSTFPASWDWSLLTPILQEDPPKPSKSSDILFGTTPTEEKKVTEQLRNSSQPEEIEISKEDEEKPEENNNGKVEPEEEIVENEENVVNVTEIEDNELEETNNNEPVMNGQHKEPEPEPEVSPVKQEDAELAEKINDDSNGEEEDVMMASDDGYKEPSETPDSQKVGVIEGIVNGDDEVETFNNDENTDEQDDENKAATLDADVTEMVEAGNMEQLAALVLNGEGDRLIGQYSDNPEIQAFLENVPIYMSKINRVHIAARDGSLKDLQAALDRRKFAIAKDPISPNGASPLHVATIFGNTSIVRYLAGRFPETVLVQDDNGRTPLHYAATLADNEHYYNLLIHLGANTATEDKFGRNAQFYSSNPEELSHQQLLEDFGVNQQTAAEMLTDKDGSSDSKLDIPLFKTEEGRYLASSLGDPLIKGLTEVANKRPEDPIAYLATYLYNFAKSNRNRDEKPEGERDDNSAENIPASIDVVTVDPEDEAGAESDTAFSASARDEHGQSMLHFAAARGHAKNALFQLLQETDINIGYRDELYRTARDVSIQANVPDNTAEIDRFVISMAAKGDTDKLVELLLEGYDHIIDIVDEDGSPIRDVVEKKGQSATVSFLHSILAFEVT